MSALVVVVAAVAVVVAFLIGAVKIVRPYQRALVERLGRTRPPATRGSP